MHITITANYPFFPISLKEAWQQVLNQLWLSFFCNQYCSNLDLNILHSYYRKVSITLPTDDTHPLASKYKNALHLNCTMQLLPTFHHTATSHLGKLGVCAALNMKWEGKKREDQYICRGTSSWMCRFKILFTFIQDAYSFESTLTTTKGQSVRHYDAGKLRRCVQPGTQLNLELRTYWAELITHAQ